MDIGQTPPIEAEATPPDISLVGARDIKQTSEKQQQQLPPPPPTSASWSQAKQSQPLPDSHGKATVVTCNESANIAEARSNGNKSNNDISSTSITEVNGNDIIIETLIEPSVEDGDGDDDDDNIIIENDSVMTNFVEIDSSHSSDQDQSRQDIITLDSSRNHYKSCSQAFGLNDSLSSNGQSEIATMTRASSQRRSVAFDSVTLFYFPRSQGFSSIPSQGGSTLGMSNKHFKRRKFSVDLFEEVKRRSRREILLKIRFESTRGSRSKSAARNNSQSNNDNNNDSNGNSSGNLSSSEEQSFDQIHCNSTSSSTSSPSPSNTTTSDDDDQDTDRDDDSFSDDQFSDISDSELEANNIFLQPLGVKLRRSLLRASGVGRIDPSEKRECKRIRESRDRAGCKCVDECIPGLCECTKLGVNCHVDRGTFPCGCVSTGCRNPMGRTEYDSKRVKGHCYDKLGVG